MNYLRNGNSVFCAVFIICKKLNFLISIYQDTSITSEMSYQNIEEYFTQFPDNVEKINVNFISNYLPDLSRFYKLKILECDTNQLTCLPLLPPTLKELYCYNNKLTWLPLLPPTLKYLNCLNNQLTYLPDLPSTLKQLSCYNNQLTSFPLLPSTLTVLDCHNNQLTSLPPLPSTLKYLNCSDNQLAYLPSVAASTTLKEIWCSDNQLTCLPLLPSKLEILYCHNNKLTCLPLLPSKLEMLNCENNQLRYLPSLPSRLEMFKFYNNSFLDYYIKDDDCMSMKTYNTQLRKEIKIIKKFRELFYTLKYKKKFIDFLWFHVREPKIKNKYHPSNLMKLLEGKEESTLDELDELLEKW